MTRRLSHARPEVLLCHTHLITLLTERTGKRAAVRSQLKTIRCEAAASSLSPGGILQPQPGRPRCSGKHKLTGRIAQSLQRGHEEAFYCIQLRHVPHTRGTVGNISAREDTPLVFSHISFWMKPKPDVYMHIFFPPNSYLSHLYMLILWLISRAAWRKKPTWQQSVYFWQERPSRGSESQQIKPHFKVSALIYADYIILGDVMQQFWQSALAKLLRSHTRWGREDGTPKGWHIIGAHWVKDY